MNNANIMSHFSRCFAHIGWVGDSYIIRVFNLKIVSH